MQIAPNYLVTSLHSYVYLVKDCIDDSDNIPQRNVIDTNTNAYGKQFIDFLQESKMCILDRRVTPDKNIK